MFAFQMTHATRRRRQEGVHIKGLREERRSSRSPGIPSTCGAAGPLSPGGRC